MDSEIDEMLDNERNKNSFTEQSERSGYAERIDANIIDKVNHETDEEMFSDDVEVR